MIEALIAYFEDKGYSVGVLPRRLIIYKIHNGQRVNVSWMLDPIEARSLPMPLLYARADYFMQQIDQAIEDGPPYI